MLLPLPLRRLLAYLLPVLLTVPAAVAQDDRGASPHAFTFLRGVNISHWLSQNNAARPYAADWFTEEDVAWIARQGFDHIRYPIDGRLWLRPDGSLDESKIKPFEKALGWTRQHGLGAILDMHFLPGASFDPGSEERAAFTDQQLQRRVADFWRQVARRFAGEGAYLRFEILNEPVAHENRQLNPFNRRMLEAIRESNPDRVVYLTSNQYGKFTTVEDLEIPDDPNVAITLHYYEPMIFSHQRASWWAHAPNDMPLVPFPGRVPDMSDALPPEHPGRAASGTELTVEDIDAAFDRVAAILQEKAPDKEVHIGEFGAYAAGPAEGRRAYVAAVARAAERHGWGWAVWDYQGGFAVRNPQGEPTEILEGLLGQ